MKKLIALLLALLLLWGCAAPAAEASTPLFWRAEDSRGHVLYLLGSIHAGDESLYPLPGVITDAYEASDALAVELDLVTYAADLNTQMAMLSAMAYTDGSTIQDHISPELYEKMVALLSEHDMYMPLFDGYNEVYWLSMLEAVTTELSGLTQQYGVDMHFTTLAHEQGKEILEVEGFDPQLELLLSTPYELLLYLLQSNAAAPAASAMLLSRLYQVYKTGDEEALISLAYADNAEAFAALENGELLAEQYAQYEKAMYHDRNRTMADKAEEYLQSGKAVFMVVGAAHMIGETGIVAELRERGYAVTKLSP